MIVWLTDYNDSSRVRGYVKADIDKYFDLHLRFEQMLEETRRGWRQLSYFFEVQYKIEEKASYNARSNLPAALHFLLQEKKNIINFVIRRSFVKHRYDKIDGNLLATFSPENVNLDMLLQDKSFFKTNPANLMDPRSRGYDVTVTCLACLKAYEMVWSPHMKLSTCTHCNCCHIAVDENGSPRLISIKPPDGDHTVTTTVKFT